MTAALLPVIALPPASRLYGRHTAHQENAALMSEGQVSCVHRGNTFFGTFVTSDIDGGDTLVTVRYNGAVRAAETEGFPIEDVAETLLCQLVAQEMVALEPLDWRLAATSKSRSSEPADWLRSVKTRGPHGDTV